MTKALYLVTFQHLATGQIQILRTGKGFWRWDHGAAFSIDDTLLATILRNTQLRARPLRVDFMHWANGDMGDGLGELVKAGEVNPQQIMMFPWADPATGADEWGLFCPVTWTELGASMASDLDEISPVIEWEYVLPFDVLDEEGKTIPAGTCLGPTITGISLVDQGFFWMDKVRVYSAKGPRVLPFLYQEETTMLTPEQLANFLAFASEEGWDTATINKIVAMMTSATEAPAGAAAPEMSAATPEANAAEVMAARASLVAACKTKDSAKIIAAQKAYSVAVAKGKQAPAATPTNPLAALLASLPKSAAAAKPAVTLAAATANDPGIAELREQLAVQKQITDGLMMKDLERQGLLVGIDDPMGLYSAAPDYFMTMVKKNITLAGSGAPAGSSTSPLRALKAVENDEDASEADHRAINAYRETQNKAGRKLSYAQAMTEWETANPKPKAKKALL